MFSIDIVIPVYNTKKYLVKCIKSVLKQSFKNFMIIIVDDGSTDGSSKICDYYADIDNRIKVIHKKNEGLSEARNTGLNCSKSDYVTFLDSDDYLSQNSLFNAFKLITKNNYPDLVVFDAVTEDTSGKIINEKRQSLKDLNVSKYQYLSNIISNYIYATSWSKIFKKTLFKNNKFLPGKINEDEFIIHKLIFDCKSPIILSSFKFYHYVKREDSITSMKKCNSNSFDGIEALIERAVFLKNIKLYKAARETYIQALLFFRIFCKNNKYKSKKNPISYKNMVIKNEYSRNYLIYFMLKFFMYTKLIKQKM